ncbi:dual specificity protein phosphatase CDC14C isoform X1 [Pieris rapae]|uniref:dual specificity protein phosphatase CDC14C isoform X1 n=1 Tax=Pieris rapae TaxID=64459 RepID=UPI001E27FA03|nr:dual specificity protein phosphatase CDC14C isoform X1 [Pieris rapae]
MTRNPDILFITEYIKNVLYFATVRQGRHLKSTADTHYFCIDNQLIYENYYSDFGPLNIGCVYKYCKLLNDKIKEFLNKQVIVHYASIDPKKKANAAFLIGCYGVLYLSLTPKDALKPLVIHGQNYRPFQDATQGDSCYTISLIDCLQALLRARNLGFFNFQDFNYEEYDRLDKIQGGDLNWLIPGKYLAFIGPVDYSVSLYHPPEMYVSYFLENNVRIVIRLNKKLYDGNVFSSVGITHYDLFFPDGTCPPRHILLKFLQISEESYDAIAVHCKAGLGRTGSLIGCYLIKHYRMTAREAIAWMRICRPGSVIGHQQDWLEQLEPWLLKQGNSYRKRMYDDINKLPTHEYGIYSIVEKIHRQKPVVFNKSPSPPPPIQRSAAQSDSSSTTRPHASKTRDVANKTPEKKFDWNVKVNTQKVTQKGDTAGSRIRRGSGAGEPRGSRPLTRANTPKFQEKTSTKTIDSNKNTTTYSPLPTFRTSEGPIFKNVSDAKNFLMRSSLFNDQKSKHLASTLTVTPQYSYKFSKLENEKLGFSHLRKPSPTPNATKVSTPFRRQLGRSPSPSPTRHATEQSRATNTPTPSTTDRFMARDSKVALREALSRLKLAGPRDGSIGAASLGARRDAPPARRAPSVRSDERPTATQGDMLNCIKFQRRFREMDKTTILDKPSLTPKEASIRVVNSRASTMATRGHTQDLGRSPDRQTATRNSSNPRPSSPKGRRTQNTYFDSRKNI